MRKVSMRRLGLLVVLLGSAAAAAGCASSGAVPRPFPVPTGPDAVSRPAAIPEGQAIASTALGLKGLPYRAGGTGPSGFDCSGLVQYVLAQHGLSFPRVVREQYRLGRSVRQRHLRPGDLVFFRIGSREVSHVGVAIGGNQFVHAPSGRGAVRTESLGAEYWKRRFAGARRVSR
jgi:cell wall-associated NlpC family hydrolase